MYGRDSGRQIVLDSPVDPVGWHGDAARRIMTELRLMAGIKMTLAADLT